MSKPPLRPAPVRISAQLQPRSPLAKLWRDPRTGKEYDTRGQLRDARSAHARSILRDFEQLVRERTLGQPAWEQLPGETSLAYSRFRTYLTMALTPRGERSMRTVATILGLKVKQIDRGAARYHWHLRAKLWDQHLMDEEDVYFSRERKMSARRQARLGMRLQSVASKGLQHLAEDPDRLSTMTPMEILKMSEAGQRVERLAHGDATTVSDGRVQLVWQGPKPGWAPEQEDEPAALPEPKEDMGNGPLLEGKVPR